MFGNRRSLGAHEGGGRRNYQRQRETDEDGSRCYVASDWNRPFIHGTGHAGWKVGSDRLGAVLEVLIAAPYKRYDMLRKEKNYYRILLPSMETQLVGCGVEASPGETMNCCLGVLDELAKLRENLGVIASSGKT